MHVLAVDTSTLVGSVAVLSDGALSAEIHAHVRQRHGEVLLPHVERVLDLAGIAPKDLDLLAVGLGPGSFTGTRIGVATLKGLALALGAPLVGVGSLVVLARALSVGEAVAVTLVDAHKGELYAAAYRIDARGGVRADGSGGPRIIATDAHEIFPPCHAPPEAAVRRVRDAIGDATPVVCGDGLRVHADIVRAHLGTFVEAPRTYDTPRASVLALCALDRFARDGASDLASLEPLYVRPSDATLPKRPLRID